MAYLKARRRADGRVSFIVRWTDSAGRECQRTYRDKSQANSALREQIAQEARHEVGDEVASRQFFRTIARAWLDVAALEVKPRTLYGYEALLATHIFPTFGDRRIGAITSHEVQRWVIGLAQQGLTNKTIRNAYTPLASTFQYAVDHRILRASPCARLRLPKRAGEAEFEGHFLSAEQVEALAADLAQLHQMFGLVVRFVATTGLRAAEVSGLQVQDVDLIRGVVHVRRTLARDKRTRQWVTGTPKSKRSRREVPVLDATVLSGLTDHLADHPRADDPTAHLFYSRVHGGGHRFDPDRPFDADNFARRSLKPALRRAGLPTSGRSGVRFHDLRHTCASLWFDAGIPLAVISRWLGHASVAVTDRVYVHLRPDDDYAHWRDQFQAAREAASERRVVPLRRHGA